LKNQTFIILIVLCSTSFATAAESVASLECNIRIGGPAVPNLVHQKVVEVISNPEETKYLSVSLDAKNGYTCIASSRVNISSEGIAETGISDMKLGLPSGESVKASTGMLAIRPYGMSLSSSSGISCNCITGLRK